ncbi:MAG: FAD-binding oxidoreductase [Myxococcales bacterium]|nr:FAD-binding oxidoreductase [Myxococcales bacterium]
MTTPAATPWPRQVLTGFGRAVRASCAFAQPQTTAELVTLVAQAGAAGLSIAFRGAGRSYGDAALNGAGLVISTERLNRILSWDATTGIIDAEAGATIEDVWRATIADGYWPPVVPGTMRPTLGGCVAMNIHGKNNTVGGPFGEHVLELDLLTADGATQTISATTHPELFHAVCGGMGLLGAVTRVKLQLHKVPSGNLMVTPIIARNLEELLLRFESRLSSADYLVAWVDCLARGETLGRGLIHTAEYVGTKDADALRASYADNLSGLPTRVMGFPKAHLWRFMRPFTNDAFVPWVNAAKYWSAFAGWRWRARGYAQSLVAFNFLLDYVTDWERAYGDGGLIQYQLFVPAEGALACMRDVLTACHQAGIVPYLGVLKRHRADDFLLSHGVDGWSLALDFRVTARGRDALWRHTEALTAIVLAYGGRFYFAKDAVLRPADVLAAYGAERLAAFKAHKVALDPTGVFSNDLFKRAVAPAFTK